MLRHREDYRYNTSLYTLSYREGYGCNTSLCKCYVTGRVMCTVHHCIRVMLQGGLWVHHCVNVAARVMGTLHHYISVMLQGGLWVHQLTVEGPSLFRHQVCSKECNADQQNSTVW